uniref:G_PROTEIN_RECEP_F1_2 domain-containing protein n=1 Tax=Macrostomum lignano TaxID=282301 RepID=A0A1I8I3X8_9PLAT
MQISDSQNDSSFALVKILDDYSTCEFNFSSNFTDWSQPHHHELLNSQQQHHYPDPLEVVIILLSLFNAAANGFSFSIFRNKAFNKSIMSVLLLGLSIFEVTFQLGQAGYYGVNLLRGCCLPPMRSRAVAIAISVFAGTSRQMSATFQLARNWTLAALSLYRCEAVCRSMARVKLFRKETSVRIVVFIGAMCSLIMLPRLFEAYEAVCYHAESQFYIVKTTSPFPPVMFNDWYKKFYLSACLFILQSGGPTITVLICSAFVLKVLWARKRFRETQNMRQRQSGTDKLIIMLALTFFVLEMPAFFSKLLFSFKALPTDVDVLLSRTANTMITLDSSLNIFIYLFSNPTFLQVAKEKICRGRCQAEANNNGQAAPATTRRDGGRGAGGNDKAEAAKRIGGSNEETAQPSPPVKAAVANKQEQNRIIVSAIKSTAVDEDDEQEEHIPTEHQALIAEDEVEEKVETAAEEAAVAIAAAEEAESARAALVAAAAAAAEVVDGSCDFRDIDGKIIELRVTEV